jgi:hypothetical protein
MDTTTVWLNERVKNSEYYRNKIDSPSDVAVVEKEIVQLGEATLSLQISKAHLGVAVICLNNQTKKRIDGSPFAHSKPKNEI